MRWPTVASEAAILPAGWGYCVEHGTWHHVEDADPSCLFEDGFGVGYDWQGNKIEKEVGHGSR